jgi:hypothetical protein
MDRSIRILAIALVLGAVDAKAQNILPATGNVGIGTTSPTNALDVVVPLVSSGTIANFVNSSDGSFTTIGTGGSSATWPTWPDGSPLLEFVPAGAGDGIISSYSGNLLFQTGGRVDHMAITSSGNVGIGTTEPAGSLHIQGSANYWGGFNYGKEFIVAASDGANHPGIGIFDDSGTIPWGMHNVGGILTFSAMPSLSDSTTLPTSVLLLTTSGRAGIGTVPNYALDVSGQVHATQGFVFADGSIQTIAYAPGGGAMWSSYNIGANVIVSGPRNNAIGFLDAGNNNPWAIYDGGSLNIAAMPALGNTSTNPTIVMTLLNSGNVGIGTTTPHSALEVNGNVTLTPGASGGSGANITFSDGTVQATAWNGTTLGGDYAESIDVEGNRAEYEPGDVIAIDGSSPGKFFKSASPYSKLVAGVYSTKPGLVGRRTTFARINKDAEVPMAMMGIAPTKVSTENGPIEPGDLLVTSSTPGYAMRATDPTRTMGAVIGKALAPLKSGSGVIEVLVSLQ